MRPADERSGMDDLSVPFSAPGAYPHVSGQCWLFTDGLYERGIEITLNGFAAAGQHLVVVHVLGPEELSPGLAGELKLIDAESGGAREVAFGKAVREAYQAALQQHIATLRKLCAERGFDYVFANTSESAVDIAVRTLLAGHLQH